jgi:hypothetical protein
MVCKQKEKAQRKGYRFSVIKMEQYECADERLPFRRSSAGTIIMASKW